MFILLFILLYFYLFNFFYILFINFRFNKLFITIKNKIILNKFEKKKLLVENPKVDLCISNQIETFIKHLSLNYFERQIVPPFTTFNFIIY